MKLQEGDVFSIKTKNGYGFLQYIETDSMGINLIRVLEPIKDNGQISQSEVDIIERWNIGFPIKAALKRGIIEKIDTFIIPSSFVNSNYARLKHFVRGEFIGWHIVNRLNLKRELKKNLSEKDLFLSPHGIMNDTLIIERLENNWRLDNWK